MCVCVCVIDGLSTRQIIGDVCFVYFEKSSL